VVAVVTIAVVVIAVLCGSGSGTSSTVGLLAISNYSSNSCDWICS